MPLVNSLTPPGNSTRRVSSHKLILTKPSSLKKKKTDKDNTQDLVAGLYRKFTSQTDDVVQESRARQRFRLAIRCVRAFVRFQMGLRGPTKAKASDKLENTFRLEPDSALRFPANEAHDLMVEVLSKALAKYSYDQSTAATMSKILSTSIIDRLKLQAQEKFPRYKLVCNVVIGEHVGQTFNCSSRALWNESTDTSACASMTAPSCFAVATVHAVYLE